MDKETGTLNDFNADNLFKSNHYQRDRPTDAEWAASIPYDDLRTEAIALLEELTLHHKTMWHRSKEWLATWDDVFGGWGVEA